MVGSSLQAPLRERQEEDKDSSPRRRKSSRERQIDEDSKTREQTDSSQPRREAAGPPWQYARASWPCAHPHCPEPGCLPHGTCSASAAGRLALSVAQ